jgi:antitoxin (DNA-binding transcriptional repressor) of toxin-antitoxin stability system
MKTYSVGEFKAHFSEILDMVQDGVEIGISYGKSKKVVAKLVPNKLVSQAEPRPLGYLKDKATFDIKSDWKMTPEEFLGL